MGGQATAAGGRLAALLADPHPGLHTWQVAVADARRVEAAERASLAAARQPTPTPGQD